MSQELINLMKAYGLTAEEIETLATGCTINLPVNFLTHDSYEGE